MHGTAMDAWVLERKLLLKTSMNKPQLREHKQTHTLQTSLRLPATNQLTNTRATHANNFETDCTTSD